MIIAPDPSRAIVREDGTMQDAFRRFTFQVSKESLIIGEGSPEGIVEAVQGREYMDSIGTTGAIKYIKRDADVGGDRKKGWILI